MYRTIHVWNFTVMPQVFTDEFPDASSYFSCFYNIHSLDACNGIGSQVTELLLSLGCSVAAASLHKEKLQQFIEECPKKDASRVRFFNRSTLKTYVLQFSAIAQAMSQ